MRQLRKQIAFCEGFFSIHWLSHSRFLYSGDYSQWQRSKKAMKKPGMRFPRTFWVSNTLEIFERMAWYGFYAVSSLYITGPVAEGGLGFSDEDRGIIQAVVTFFLYLFPAVTGALADRFGF
jgi:dipeptide/tripeptide permease